MNIGLVYLNRPYNNNNNKNSNKNNEYNLLKGLEHLLKFKQEYYLHSYYLALTYGQLN